MDLLANNYTVKLFTFKKEDRKIKEIFYELKTKHGALTGWSLCDYSNYYLIVVFDKPNTLKNTCTLDEFLLLLRMVQFKDIIFYYSTPHLFCTIINTYFGNSTGSFPHYWVFLNTVIPREVTPKHMYYSSYKSVPFFGEPAYLNNLIFELDENTEKYLVLYFQNAE